MRKRDKLKVYFVLSVLCLFIMSATILFMQFSVNSSAQGRMFVVAVGLTFWISALSGYTFIFIANRIRKKIMGQITSDYAILRGRPGIICFFSNIYATVADTAMFLSFVLFAVVNFTELKTSYWAYIFLFLLIFSLHMHCLFNSKIFKLLQLLKVFKNTKRGKKHE